MKRWVMELEYKYVSFHISPLVIKIIFLSLIAGNQLSVFPDIVMIILMVLPIARGPAMPIYYVSNELSTFH